MLRPSPANRLRFEARRGRSFGGSGALPLTAGLLSYWKMDEVSGTRSDSYGTNHLTDNNTVGSVAGKIGNAAQLVAVNNEWLSVASNADLQVTARLTVAGWFWRDTAIRSNLFSKGVGLGTAEYSVEVNPGGTVYCEGFAGGYASAVAVGTAATGAWHFVCAYFDPILNQVGIRLNGGAFATAAWADTGAVGTSDLRLGSIATGDYDFDGRLDEWGLWRGRALTNAEVDTLYNGGSGLTYPF